MKFMDSLNFTKDPFAGPDQVVEYLGRYMHKVAISNHRLRSMDETGVEFLRRFCQHVLPKGFVRIRHYGLLSSGKNPC